MVRPEGYPKKYRASPGYGARGVQLSKNSLFTLKSIPAMNGHSRGLRTNHEMSVLMRVRMHDGRDRTEKTVFPAR